MGLSDTLSQRVLDPKQHKALESYPMIRKSDVYIRDKVEIEKSYNEVGNTMIILLKKDCNAYLQKESSDFVIKYFFKRKPMKGSNIDELLK